MASPMGPLVVGQLEFYWDTHLQPRLAGLTDDEYFWEPVAGSWNLRRNSSGAYVLDDAFPAPDPPPFTTIAWRMTHISVGCFAKRAHTFFEVPEHDSLPGTANEALALLEDTYHRWFDHIAALDDEALSQPVGPRAGRYRLEPMAGMIMHINREVIHHGAEICLLRDLYRDRNKP